MMLCLQIFARRKQDLIKKYSFSSGSWQLEEWHSCQRPGHSAAPPAPACCEMLSAMAFGGTSKQSLQNLAWMRQKASGCVLRQVSVQWQRMPDRFESIHAGILSQPRQDSSRAAATCGVFPGIEFLPSGKAQRASAPAWSEKAPMPYFSIQTRNRGYAYHYSLI